MPTFSRISLSLGKPSHSNHNSVDNSPTSIPFLCESNIYIFVVQWLIAMKMTTIDGTYIFIVGLLCILILDSSGIIRHWLHANLELIWPMKKWRRNYHFFLLHIYSLRDVIARNSKTLLRFITRTKQVWRRADMVYFLSDPDLTFYVTKLKIIRFITYHDGRDSFWTLKSYIYGNN